MNGALDRLVLRARGTLATAEPMLRPRWANAGAAAGWSEISNEQEAGRAPAPSVAPSASVADSRAFVATMERSSAPLPGRPTPRQPEAAPLAATPTIDTAQSSARQPPVERIEPLPAHRADPRPSADVSAWQTLAPPASTRGVRPGGIEGASAPTSTNLPSPDVASPVAPARAVVAAPAAAPAAPLDRTRWRPGDGPSVTPNAPPQRPDQTRAPIPAKPPGDVRITIGRVDVQAPSPPPTVIAPAARPRLSLADYQRQRRERGR